MEAQALGDLVALLSRQLDYIHGEIEEYQAKQLMMLEVLEGILRDVQQLRREANATADRPY